MRRVAGGGGNSLIPLLALFVLVLVVVGWLLLDIQGPRVHTVVGRQKGELDNLMMALTEYHNQFAAYPPGGTDLNDDGDLDDPGESFGSGKPPSDPEHPNVAELQLRALCVKLPVENNTNTVGPYYSPNATGIDEAGRLIDVWDRPFRYLADGRRTKLDPATRKPLHGRVARREPVIWSVGPDGRQDPGNNNLDDDGDGRIDEPDELVDDICSWN